MRELPNGCWVSGSRCVKRALLHPDALERRALVIACFEGMDATNWLGMYEQFKEVTRESGVIHPTDQRMSLMAATRKEAALDWLAKHPDDPLAAELRTMVR